jgi:glycosyltransferase involved in cell wall biosynthesis
MAIPNETGCEALHTIALNIARLARPFSVLHMVPALFAADDGIMGGAERYAFELARCMAREVPTRLLTFGGCDRTETIDNLSLRVIGHPWYVRQMRTNPCSVRLLPELAQADVVHCHQRHVLASSIAALFCRLSRRRVYVTDLGGGGFDLSAFIPTHGWYDGHLHISQYSRRIYRHEHLGSAHVIFGGVDTARFSPAELTKQKKVVYVGRLLPHKGIDVLIEAMPADVDLDVIGQVVDSRYLADLHRLASGKRVNFRHDCDDSMLIGAYRAAACVVLPSVHTTIYGEETPVPELLGQTLLEGMACGAPAICTNVASMPEIVLDGITGFVVPPRDPVALRERIRWLLDHPAEGAAMGSAGRRRVLEKFTWPAVVARCLEIYQLRPQYQPATSAR